MEFRATWVPDGKSELPIPKLCWTSEMENAGMKFLPSKGKNSLSTFLSYFSDRLYQLTFLPVLLGYCSLWSQALQTNSISFMCLSSAGLGDMS